MRSRRSFLRLLGAALALGAVAALAFVPRAREAFGIAARERVYWPNGRLRWEGRGKPRAESGRWSYWYENGNPRERGEYKDARRIGTWTQWHNNGQRASEGERVWNPASASSPRQGAWTFWHENGDLAARGSYTLGRREGPWEFWRPDPGGGPPLRDNERSGTYVQGVRAAAQSSD